MAEPKVLPKTEPKALSDDEFFGSGGQALSDDEFLNGGTISLSEPPPESGLMSGLSAIRSGITNAVTNSPGRMAALGSNVYDSVSEGVSNLAASKPTSLEQMLSILAAPALRKAGNRFASQSVPQTISDIAAPTIGAVPFAGPPLVAGIETAADASDEYRGLAEATSWQDKLRKATDIAVSGVGPDLALRGLSWAAQKSPRVLQDIGRNKEVMLSEQSNQPGISAALQDAPKGTTPAERQVMFDIEPHEKRFFEKGIPEGIDTSVSNRSKAYNEYLGKLKTVKDAALEAKGRIIEQADAALQGSEQPGMTLSDVDVSKLDNLINSDLASEFTADTASISQNAKQNLRSDFSNTTYGAVSGRPLDSAPKVMSIGEVQEYIRRLDDTLEQLGTFDDKRWAQIQQNPSEVANLQARVKAIRAARTALNEGLIEKVGSVLGEDKALALRDANADASMAIEYGNLGNRFRAQTMEGLTPGSGRSLTAPKVDGPIKQGMNAVLNYVNPFYKSGQAMERGRSAVKALQELAPYVRGEAEKVYPRDFSLRPGMSPAASGIGTLGAVQSFANAPAMPPMLPRSSAIFQNPQALVQAVARASGGNPQLMHDVQSVLSEPNSSKRDMAMMELTKMLPNLFEPSPYKSLWNGRIADPMEQKMYVDDLKSKHRSGQIDANYLAKSISAANADGTVLPPPPPIPPTREQPVSRMGLERREYSY